MGKKTLSKNWVFKRADQSEWQEAKVPGSVTMDLLRIKQIKNPFFRVRISSAQQALTYDYQYLCRFTLSEKELSEFSKLCFEGIDTLATVCLNNVFVGTVNNMHRRFTYDVKAHLKPGENILEIKLQSAVYALAEKEGNLPLWGMKEAIAGFQHIRKASYMFGWDWNYKLPDMGIWRKVYLADRYYAGLDDVRIVQMHGRDRVDLRLEAGEIPSGSELEWCVYHPDGTIAGKAEEESARTIITIENPCLWWPRGYGEQPLYRVDIVLKQRGEILCRRTMQLGLRTVRLNQDADDYGNKFQIEINGVPIFVRGADYVPQDSFAARVGRSRIKKLIEQCVYGNFNCIRVWGGGYYPEDFFYELCDRHGLLVWQDLMLACAFYKFDETFQKNIQAEIRENVRRLRHHPALMLWCGNNEVEWKINEKGVAKKSKIRADYLRMAQAIKEIVEQEDGVTPYWHSSPSSTGDFDDPNSGRKGDTHYWGVWHDRQPIATYREHETRFVSEFGFESFPTMEQLRRITFPQDRRLNSPIIKMLQINPEASDVIKEYMAEAFPIPNNLEAMVYFSQLLQARAVEYAVRFWRSQHDKCMGVLYWQLNDCCPVVSWSGIDYAGNRKALHYYARRFYKDILVSADEKNQMLRFCVVNDTRNCFKGRVYWRLRKNDFSLLSQGYNCVIVPSLHRKWFGAIDIRRICEDETLQQTTFLEYCLRDRDEKVVSKTTYLFLPDKDFRWKQPHIRKHICQRADSFEIVLKAQSYARAVFLDLPGCLQEFSDNFFDISCEEDPVRVILPKRALPGGMTREMLEERLRVHSMYDYMSEEAQKR